MTKSTDTVCLLEKTSECSQENAQCRISREGWLAVEVEGVMYERLADQVVATGKSVVADPKTQALASDL